MHRRATTQPEVALASIYDTGKTNNIPFVASLGNHDGALPHYSRAQVMRYIAADPRSLVTENEIDGSVGNYYLDLVHRGSRAPVARLWFLDARLEPGLPNILDAQLEWLEATAAELPPAPSLAFFHIPLPEYSTAPRVSGTLRESVSADQPNRATFSRLRTALGRGLIATFCGHDHTNDFCAALDGVRLVLHRLRRLHRLRPPDRAPPRAGDGADHLRRALPGAHVEAPRRAGRRDRRHSDRRRDDLDRAIAAAAEPAAVPARPRATTAAAAAAAVECRPRARRGRPHARRGGRRPVGVPALPSGRSAPATAAAQRRRRRHGGCRWRVGLAADESPAAANDRRRRL